ncbi:hypothetical protein TNCV_2363311 [Trichonephila clavipes]|nr:hypothetical protein TNCV_2363311 [Trichonephila clavipes]
MCDEVKKSGHERIVPPIRSKIKALKRDLFGANLIKGCYAPSCYLCSPRWVLTLQYGYLDVFRLVESVPDHEEIGNLIEEVVDFSKKINLEKDRDIQELLDSHNQELTIDDLIERQDIEELESLDPIQSKDQMTDENLTEASV